MSSDEEGEASAATESEEEAPKKTPSESRGELNPLSKRKKLVLLHAILPVSYTHLTLPTIYSV